MKKEEREEEKKGGGRRRRRGEGGGEEGGKEEKEGREGGGGGGRKLQKDGLVRDGSPVRMHVDSITVSQPTVLAPIPPTPPHLTPPENINASTPNLSPIGVPAVVSNSASSNSSKQRRNHHNHTNNSPDAAKIEKSRTEKPKSAKGSPSSVSSKNSSPKDAVSPTPILTLMKSPDSSNNTSLITANLFHTLTRTPMDASLVASPPVADVSPPSTAPSKEARKAGNPGSAAAATRNAFPSISYFNAAYPSPTPTNPTNVSTAASITPSNFEFAFALDESTQEEGANFRSPVTPPVVSSAPTPSLHSSENQQMSQKDQLENPQSSVLLIKPQGRSRIRRSSASSSQNSSPCKPSSTSVRLSSSQQSSPTTSQPHAMRHPQDPSNLLLQQASLLRADASHIIFPQVPAIPSHSPNFIPTTSSPSLHLSPLPNTYRNREVDTPAEMNTPFRTPTRSRLGAEHDNQRTPEHPSKLLAHAF